MGSGTGAVPSNGAGIYNSGTLTVTNSVLTGNWVVGYGGAIFSSGTAAVTHSALSNNKASGAGGPGLGGGIYSSGALSVADSDLSGNIAVSGGNNVVGRGGGIYNDGSLIVTNSTLSGNRGDGSESPSLPISGGGGIYNDGPLSLVTSSTLSGNVANHGGGIYNSGTTAVMALVNAILASNNPVGVDPDCVGLVTSLGNNLIGNATGCTIALLPNDRTGNPRLGAFTDNNTPGNGHFPLLPNSQAIDVGNDTFCPGTDELGHRRQGACDIGSIEFRQSKDR